MKVFFVALAVLSMAAAESNIACTKKLCEEICLKAPTQEECRQRGMEYQQNTSFCACCATCVEYIPLLGECDVERNNGLRIRGGPPRVQRHCAPGTVCINHKCLVIAQ